MSFGNGKRTLSFIDLFCGVGGFHFAVNQVAPEFGLVPELRFASDIDNECRRTYVENFNVLPHGDIKEIDSDWIPSHDLLLAGFPCQPFSICGDRRGFEDTRGTLFFDIARILDAKKPAAFVLENVKLLVGHDRGRTLRVILDTLAELGYQADFRVLNALDFGLPQKRERVLIVGFREPTSFSWPEGKVKMRSLEELLEKDVPESFYASDYIRTNRMRAHRKTEEVTIWHENKAGHISVYPFSCALRAGASYNYLLVNGERRLTPREMFRLQGFPEEFKIVSGYAQARKQAGNAVPVPVVAAVLRSLLAALSGFCPSGSERVSGAVQWRARHGLERTSAPKC